MSDSMNKPSIAAIVPMRHFSARVPGKNYRLFCGRPLYHRVIQAVLDSNAVERVVIDTDSPTIRQDAQLHFPEVQLIERPEHLRGETVPMNSVLLHTTQQVQADLYLQTHSTNPLLSAETVRSGIARFLQERHTYDSMFSVTRLQTRLWDALARPLNHNSAILLRTQDLPPVYEENSCMYLFDRPTLENLGNRIGRRPMLFEIAPREAVDIDEELDFEVAELLFQRTQGSQSH